jgi:hypothetical protein
MYGLPKGFDAGFLVGRTLETVLFSENTVSFTFGDRVSVTVTSALQHQLSSESDQPNVQSVPLSESKLMQLPGHCVTQAKGEEEGTLVLVFDNGHVLKVFDNDPHYECYSINDGEHEIFV